jgi:hypothetical protein
MVDVINGENVIYEEKDDIYAEECHLWRQKNFSARRGRACPGHPDQGGTVVPS